MDEITKIKSMHLITTFSVFLVMDFQMKSCFKVKAIFAMKAQNLI